MKIGFSPVLALLFILTAATDPSIAQETQSASQILRRLQAVYERTEDLKADFHQETIIKILEKTRRAEGKVYLKKPGKMRWRYLQGEQKEIIIDGNRMWMYDPQENQVTVTDLSRSPEMRPFIALLMGGGSLQKDFEIIEGKAVRRDEKGRFILKMKPRDTSTPLAHLSLIVNPKTFLIEGTSFLGLQGDPTIIRYSNIQINQGLPDELFGFTIPEGAEVLYYPPEEGDSGRGR